MSEKRGILCFDTLGVFRDNTRIGNNPSSESENFAGRKGASHVTCVGSARRSEGRAVASGFTEGQVVSVAGIEILQRTRRILDDEGLGSWYFDGRRSCALGALMRAEGSYVPWEVPYFGEAWRARSKVVVEIVEVLDEIIGAVHHDTEQGQWYCLLESLAETGRVDLVIQVIDFAIMAMEAQS